MLDRAQGRRLGFGRRALGRCRWRHLFRRRIDRSFRRRLRGRAAHPRQGVEPRDVAADAKSAIAAKLPLAVERRQAGQLDRQAIGVAVDRPGDGQAAPGVAGGERLGDASVRDRGRVRPRSPAMCVRAPRRWRTGERDEFVGAEREAAVGVDLPDEAQRMPPLGRRAAGGSAGGFAAPVAQAQPRLARERRVRRPAMPLDDGSGTALQVDRVRFHRRIGFGGDAPSAKGGVEGLGFCRHRGVRNGRCGRPPPVLSRLKSTGPVARSAGAARLRAGSDIAGSIDDGRRCAAGSQAPLIAGHLRFARVGESREQHRIPASQPIRSMRTAQRGVRPAA